MTTREFYKRLCELYPTTLSCSWDNDGFMCCTDENKKVEKVLVALDATIDSINYAVKGGYDTLLVHHPLIFKAIDHLNGSNAVENRVLAAVKNGLCVISLHTRLDCGKNGVNDTLAKILGLVDVEVFGDSENPDFARIGYTDKSKPEDFANLLKEATGAKKVTGYLCRPIKKVAVVGGSAGEFFAPAKNHGADTIVTGECKYHEGLDAKDFGINLFTIGHYYSEFPVTKTLKMLAEDEAGAVADIYFEEPEITF